MWYYVPQELKRRNLWGLWRREDGRKVPYSCDPRFPNRKISKQDARLWRTYDEADTKKTFTGDEFDGLGFLFTNVCGLVFIDLDHCLNDEFGEPNDFAAEIIELFRGNYIEYSVSGTGVHIVCKGRVPSFLKEKHIEIYGNGTQFNQYMAFTGQYIEGGNNEPQFAQDALNELIRRFDIKPKPKAEPISDEPITADDERIIDLLSDDRTNDNAQQFRALWAGNWHSCSRSDVERCSMCPLHRQRGRLCFKSQSEADFRLIRMIKSYSKNFEQTARLFRHSELNRSKATDEYIRRIFEYSASEPPYLPVERRKGQSATNPPRGTQNAVKSQINARTREGMTDTPKNKRMRAWWK